MASPRVQIAARVGLGRLGRKQAAVHLLKTPVPVSLAAPAKDTEGLHATPNAAVILPHIAVRALVSLQAVDACVEAIEGNSGRLALWALRYMHDIRAVDGLYRSF